MRMRVLCSRLVTLSCIPDPVDPETARGCIMEGTTAGASETSGNAGGMEAATSWRTASLITSSMFPNDSVGLVVEVVVLVEVGAVKTSGVDTAVAGGVVVGGLEVAGVAIALVPDIALTIANRSRAPNSRPNCTERDEHPLAVCLDERIAIESDEIAPRETNSLLDVRAVMLAVCLDRMLRSG